MTEIPEGMKPWNGGDGPPEDWDGGVVILRDGRTTHDTVRSNGTLFVWDRGGFRRNDIIAYTPKPPAYPEGMTPELAQRMVEHFKTVCAKYPTGKNPLAAEARAIMAELEPDPLAKAIDDAWVRLPPEWARETFVAHMTSELRKAGATITETKQ